MSAETQAKTSVSTSGKAIKRISMGEEAEKIYVWELPVRIFHWINAISIFVLFFTGIYIGKPFFGATVPGEAYYSFVMGWVRYVHFLAAFIFTLNLVVRAYWFWKGNEFAKIRPYKKEFWEGLWETTKSYLFLKNKKKHYVGHNPLAQFSYLIFIGLGSIIMILTGFYLYFEPQLESPLGSLFAWVPFVFGGESFSVRAWHHLVAWGFMIFVIVHVYMAFREDWLSKNGTMSSIFTGYKMERKQKKEE